MKRLSSKILMSLCGFALIAATLVGNETSENTHMPIGVRAMPMEQRMAQQEARAKLAAENPQVDVSKAANDLLLPKSAKSVQAMAMNVYYTTHPGVYHRPMNISMFGDSVELEDGSCWSIYPGDAYITQGWIPSDLIVITPNHSWFSSYDFKLTNQSTGEAVLTNLFLGPIYNSPYTHWIIAIDYYNNIIYLEDGSLWSMTSFDSGTINQWMVNDTVIIGINDGWLSSSRSNILINVNMLNYAAGSVSY